MMVLLGKTCAGKDSILKHLVNMGLKPIISYTTRPMRPGEVNGVTYHFITKETFIERYNDGFFAETTHYDVATGERWYYGTAVEDIKDNAVCILNPDGLNQMKQLEDLRIVSFYLKVNSNIIWGRLVNRGGDMNEAKRRLEADEHNFRFIEDVVDYSFTNDGELKPDIMAEMIKYTYDKSIKGKTGGNNG